MWAKLIFLGRNFFALYFCLGAVFALISNSAIASDSKFDLNLNNLRVTNRAQCALDSKVPTDSVFLLIDGYNAGKLGFQLAKTLGEDPEVLSKSAMRDFRFASQKILIKIVNLILTGHLPLLPTNIQANSLAQYKKMVKICDNKIFCLSLNNYLKELWGHQNQRGNIEDWKKVDTFGQENFFPKNGYIRGVCHYVQRFSSLQGHLHNPKISRELLREIGQDWQKRDQLMRSCHAEDSDLDSRNSIIQFDILIDSPSEWDKKGFDFWNSVKIYFSWAWRNTDLLSEFTPSFGEVFKSLALEESLLIVPNGCKSVTRPECDSATLSMNSLRDLVKPNAPDSRHSQNLPPGPEDSILERGARGVNDDFLGTLSFTSASEWLMNFRKNYVQARGFMKNRVQSSIEFLAIVSDVLSPQQISDFVQSDIEQIKSLPQFRDELYYLCTEMRLAADKKLDFLKTDIDRIEELNVMKAVFEGSSLTPKKVVDYFDNTSANILPFCEALEKSTIWKGTDYKMNPAGFQDWAKELLQIPKQESTDSVVEPHPIGPPFLVWDKNRPNQFGNVICLSSLECARHIIRAMVDLYAVAKYAEAFLPVSAKINSPNVFNPYAELVACKVYDPWFVSKKVYRRMLADAASTAMFGWNYLPIYVDVDFTWPKVSSISDLIQDGVIKFDPRIQKSRIQASLIADFGSLIGAPCSIVITPINGSKIEYYAFKGISLNYCHSKTSEDYVGKGPGDIQTKGPKSYSFCGGCSLNFVSIGSGVSMATSAMLVNPVKLGVYLFRTIYRYVQGMSDEINVPQKHVIDLKKVGEAYERFGDIPEECVENLTRGLGCHESRCESKVIKYLEDSIHVKAYSLEYTRSWGFDRSKRQARFQLKECRGDLRLNFTCESNTGDFQIEKAGLVATTKDCQQFIERRISNSNLDMLLL